MYIIATKNSYLTNYNYRDMIATYVYTTALIGNWIN